MYLGSELQNHGTGLHLGRWGQHLSIPRDGSFLFLARNSCGCGAPFFGASPKSGGLPSPTSFGEFSTDFYPGQCSQVGPLGIKTGSSPKFHLIPEGGTGGLHKGTEGFLGV